MSTKKKIRKALILLLCALLLMSCTVMGTMAYLSARTGTVKNTFTVGNVAITLDESKVNTSGQRLKADGTVFAEGTDPVSQLAPRVTENSYKLMPGLTYVKDPVVHFKSGSAACWLFVELKNDIAPLMEGAESLEQQMTALPEGRRWTLLDGADPIATPGSAVYYLRVPANDTAEDIDYPLFHSFKIADSAENLGAYSDKQILLTAFAIQEADAFSTPQDAWRQLAGSKPVA